MRPSAQRGGRREELKIKTMSRDIAERQPVIARSDRQSRPCAVAARLAQHAAVMLVMAAMERSRPVDARLVDRAICRNARLVHECSGRRNPACRSLNDQRQNEQQ